MTDNTQSTELTIEAVVHGGYGIARAGDETCFVINGLPGDTVRVRVSHRARKVLWAEIEEVLEPSADRAVAVCPRFGECGGCSWLNFCYPAQAEWKRRIVTDCLRRIAGLDVDPGWRECEQLRLGYRTRAEFHGNGRGWGFLARQSHRVMPIEACPLCHPRLNGALGRLHGAVGVKQPVEFTVNPLGEEVLVWSKGPVGQLDKLFETTNSARDRGHRHSFLFDGVAVVNGGFSQSSLLLNRMLVQCVHEAVGDASRVLDLFCGNGNLSMTLAQAQGVVGLDHNRFAIKAAAERGIGHYETGGAKEMVAAIKRATWDVILLDPPRSGAKALTTALAHSRADRIVYVSCDPATLARDAARLGQEGWEIRAITALDMFPNTAHVETVCVFQRP